MIETEGTVVAVEAGLAWVETNRRSACGHCESSGACATSLLANTFGNRPTRVEVENRIGARVGERVVLGLSGRGMLLGSFLLYLTPLAGLFAGALLGQYFGLQLAAGSVEPWAASGGLLGLMAAFGLLRVLDISILRSVTGASSHHISGRDPGRSRPVMVRRLAPGAFVPPPQTKIEER
ncbi:MAG: hypothetical protein A2514_00590 [Gammaproteobacteria bacterium RIFOXYD12_FULL_61_37]|nr:MAG: hypothetical protein A2514_00590 [Gammaproteobacteria bacterium RIFOXYD12_FULL_61_37]